MTAQFALIIRTKLQVLQELHEAQGLICVRSIAVPEKFSASAHQVVKNRYSQSVWLTSTVCQTKQSDDVELGIAVPCRCLREIQQLKTWCESQQLTYSTTKIFGVNAARVYCEQDELLVTESLSRRQPECCLQSLA